MSFTEYAFIHILYWPTLFYFLLAPRRIDVFFIWFIAFSLHFSSVIYGYIPPLGGRSDMYPGRAPHPETAKVFIIILLSHFSWTVFNDRILNLKDHFRGTTNRNQDHERVLLLFVWMVISVSSVALFIILNVEFFHAKSKRDIMDQSGFEIVILIVTSTIFSVYAIENWSNKFFVLIAGAIILFTLLIGQRTVVATIILAVVLLIGTRTGVQNLAKDNYLLLGVGAAGVVVIAMLKPIYTWFLAGMQGMPFRSFDDAWNRFWVGFEPGQRQYILDEIIRRDFTVDFSVWGNAWISFLPIPSRWLGWESGIFNQLFQKQLFPDAYWGLAYNPWAEAWAVAGLFGVLVLAFVHSGVIFLLNYCLFAASYRWRIILVIVGVIMSFWFERNSLAVSAAYLRNVIWPFLAVLFIVLLLACVGRKSSKVKENSQ